MSATIDRLIPPREARKLLGIGKTSEVTYRQSLPGFPPRVQVGPHRYAYRQSDIAAFIAALPVAPPAPAPEHALAARRAKRAASAAA